jgi:AraC family transcriptional regulator, positive regulator of tynA and feaB
VHLGRLESFSTNALPIQKRIGYWNDLSCNTFTGVGVDPAGKDDFSASLRRLKLDTVCIADVRSSASIVRHTSGHVSRLREEPFFLLHMQLRGSSVNAQSGREAFLQPGDATICDTGRPWTLAFDQNARFLVCRLPTSKMRERLGEIEDLPGIYLRRSAGGLAVLSSFLQTLLLQAGHAEDTNWLEDIDSIVMDLVAMSCRASLGHNAANRVPSARYESVLRYITQNLSDPTVDVNLVAAHFGLGARSIQKLFAAHGTTFGAHISRQRLHHAAARLAESGSQSITEIALDAGFNDLTYFGRAFRYVFGMSPREYRQHLHHADSRY